MLECKDTPPSEECNHPCDRASGTCCLYQVQNGLELAAHGFDFER